MIQALRNAMTLPDLRRKLLSTLLLLVVYRLASHVPVPGVNQEALQQLLTEAVRRRRRPRSTAITRLKGQHKPLNCHSTSSNLKQRAHNAAHHPIEERVSFYVHRYPGHLTTPVYRKQTPHRDAPLRWLTERREVVFANQTPGSPPHLNGIKRM